METDSARSRRRWTITAIAVAALLVAAVIAGVILSGVWAEPEATDATPGSTTSDGPNRTTGGSATGDPANPGNDPGTGSESPGAEGPPSDGATPDTSTGLPLPDAEGALIALPLPPDAHAEGAIADGFPTDIIGLPPLATVGSSSLASEGMRLQAGLSGTSPQSADAVMAFYRDSLGQHGMGGRAAAAAPASQSMAFTLGANTVTVTVTTVESGAAFDVLGVFTAE